MADMMKRMSSMGVRERMKKMQEIHRVDCSIPAQIAKQKIGTGKRLTAAEKAKLRKEREREPDAKTGRPKGNGRKIVAT